MNLTNANIQYVLYSYQMNFYNDGDDTDEKSFFDCSLEI